jgi:diguanylate cyclase (GGDEF)-like protein
MINPLLSGSKASLRAAVSGNVRVPLLDTSATWIAVGVAVGAAVVALALALAVLLAVRRQKRPPRQIEELLAEAGKRFEDSLRELTGALEEAREESQRARMLSAIGSTIDLDAVLTRTLEAASSLPVADAAMIVLPQGEGGGEPLIAAIGMSAEEAARQPVEGPPDGGGARAVQIAYSYAEAELEGNDELVRGGLAVQLRDEEGGQIGTLAIFWRGSDREVSEPETERLEELAARSGLSIDNARRFREARQLADLDALTNLHNRRYFHETLARECSRAHRYDRRLALVIFDIDDFKAINDRIGHLAGDAVLASVAERLQSVVRSADIACRVGGDEFAVILPESTVADAEQLYRRVQFAVGSRPVEPFDRLHLSAGIADLKREDDAKTFFERTDQALYRAKEGGKGQVVDAEDRSG